MADRFVPDWRTKSDEELLDIVEAMADRPWPEPDGREFFLTTMRGAIARRHEPNFDRFLKGFFEGADWGKYG